MDRYAEFSQLIQDIIESSAILFQKSENKPNLFRLYLDKIPQGFSDLSLLHQFLTQYPDIAEQQYLSYCQEAQALLQNQLLLWSGNASLPIVQPDRRFEAKAWSEHPFFQLISQHYLLLEKHVVAILANLPNKDQSSCKRIKFLLQQICYALSPENFFATNPQLMKETSDSNGLNLLRGLRHFLDDLKTQTSVQWTMPLADGKAFEVGKDLAMTPGHVVYQNELIELILYKPQTKKVHAIPLLMIPPWINKYYILDLRPENSLVSWLVEQGIMVFMISWRNPNKSHAHLGLSDYLHLGPIAAIEFIQNTMQIPKLSALGFCIGGTLLSILLAYYQAQGIDSIVSATLIASLIDFSEPGELGVFIHEQQIQALELRMQDLGYLEGEVMAAAFNALRPGELIWRVFVQRYLFGESPLAFDLLFWNMDSTNMPAKMHSEYLRSLYLANDLVKPGKLEINQVPLDVTQIDVPSFFLSTQKDHIALWQSTYNGFNLLKGPKKFVLGGSGHIAGVVNAPSTNKYGYYINHDYPTQAEKWLENAQHHLGSWWPEWLLWLKDYSGPTVLTYSLYSKETIPVLRDAPGLYVYAKS